MNIWFDFENAPHVWILKEIIEYFVNRDFRIILTARDFSATVALSKYCNFDPKIIGNGNQKKSPLFKMTKIVNRAFLLIEYIRALNIKPQIAISHGSRSQALASYLMRIPVISLDDYEHSFKGFNQFVDHLLTPFPIDKKEWGRYAKKVVHYPGLKEELYLWRKENYSKKEIDYRKSDMINILFRPEGRFTHYANEKSMILQNKVIELFQKTKNAHIILIARDKWQESELTKEFQKRKITYTVPQTVLNGPALIANCDAVFGGGGTMTREAAVLNVPSFSFFGGKIGGVDRYLIQNNKLNLITNNEDIEKIYLFKKDNTKNPTISKKAFDFVSKFIETQLN